MQKNTILIIVAAVVLVLLFVLMFFVGSEPAAQETPQASGLQNPFFGGAPVEETNGKSGWFSRDAETFDEVEWTDRWNVGDSGVVRELTATPPPQHQVEQVSCPSLSQEGTIPHEECCGAWASGESVTLVGSMPGGSGAMCIYHF